MKKIAALILFLASFSGFSQETPIDDTHAIDSVTPEQLAYPMAAVQIKPEFPGGIKKFHEFFANNFRQPSQKGLNVKMFVSFIIDQNGFVTNIQIIQDPGYGCASEAIRVLNTCPQWIPGTQNGRNVPVLFQFPIQIKT